MKKKSIGIINRIAMNLMAFESVSKVFDVKTAKSWVNALNKQIEAPVVSAQESTLGGAERVSIILLVSFDKKENWQNGYLENSRYFRMHIDNSGIIEQFAVSFGAYLTEGGRKSECYPVLNFRKTRALTVEEAIYKINRYIQISEEFMKKNMM